MSAVLVDPPVVARATSSTRSRSSPTSARAPPGARRSTGSPRKRSRRWSRSTPTCAASIPVALRRWRRHPLAAATWREIGRVPARPARSERYAAVLDLQEQVKGALIARAGARARGTAPTARASASRSPRSRTTRITRSIPRQHLIDRCRQLAARGARLRRRRPAALRPRRRRRRRRRVAATRPYVVLRARDEPRRQAVAGSALARADRGVRARRLSPCCCRGAATQERARSERARARRRAPRSCRRGSRCRRSPALLARAELVVGVDTGLVAPRRRARHADDRAVHRHRSGARRRRARQRARARPRATRAACRRVADVQAAAGALLRRAPRC